MTNGNTVDEKSIKNWLDIAPHYIGFFIAFLKSPSTALLRVKGASKISPDLVSTLIGGIALSYFIVLAVQPPGLAADSAAVVGLLRKIDRNSMPFVALILIVFVAVIGHMLAKIVARVLTYPVPGTSALPGPDLGGTVEDSVNAALGFGAVFIPIAVGIILLVLWLPNFWFVVGAPLGLAVLSLAYLSRALSATHPNTTVVQAFLAIGVAVSAVAAASDFIH
jgi:hypothetical protein